MKVLVTGATSGLGRNAVEFLCQKGISVRATGRNEAMGKLLEKMGAEFVPADLTELVSSQAKVMLAGIDTLWHCSSFTSPWGTQQAFDLANVRATRRLGEWAVAWGVRNFIHISSPSLYFDYHHHRDIKEDFRPHRFANEFARSMERLGRKSAKEPPLTHYGVSKLNFDFTLDITRAQEELGYQPVITLDEGIEKTAAWLRDHGKLPR
ncbi:TPA: SDR family NAD(P)-dependent oxidoreductase [Shigella dysenteriae]|nr:SDR family NAD(P)-dependent oxidoreductase [Shigella dysenteriae]